MCMFSRPVRLVANTRIYARGLDGGEQALVYQMHFAADEALAMVLPLPVPPRSNDDAVTFVDLQDHPTFFDEVERAFPMFESVGRSGVLSGALPAPQALTVHDVGDYEASFVPSRADFSRLDARFALPTEVMDALPRYDDWGFAVFKLKPAVAAGRRGWRWWRGWRSRAPSPPTPLSSPKKVHPMAMRFPRRDPSRLFFPTVHVHDGTAPKQARFDHALYAQLDPKVARTCQWERSHGPASDTVSVGKTKGLVEGASPLYKVNRIGLDENVDVELVTPRLTAPHDLDLGAEGRPYRCEVRARAAHRSDLAAGEAERAAIGLARYHLDEFVAALDDELIALTVERSEAWSLMPYSNQLPLAQVDASDRVIGTPMFMGGAGDPTAPLRLQFWTEVNGVEGQLFELAFARVPAPTQIAQMREALAQALSRAVDRVLGAGRVG